MKVEIATWDDPEDVQNLINAYNEINDLDIQMITFENRGGTFFATIESDRMTREDAFQLGKNYGMMVENYREQGML